MSELVVRMLAVGDVGGGVWNIACCRHLVWHSSTTTRRSRSESVTNMHDRTSPKLHSKSKVIQYFFFVHYCNKYLTLKGKRKRKKRNIFIAHNTVGCPSGFFSSLVHIEWWKDESERGNILVHVNTTESVWRCARWGSEGSWVWVGAVQWDFRQPHTQQCSPGLVAQYRHPIKAIGQKTSPIQCFSGFPHRWKKTTGAIILIEWPYLRIRLLSFCFLGHFKMIWRIWHIYSDNCIIKNRFVQKPTAFNTLDCHQSLGTESRRLAAPPLVQVAPSHHRPVTSPVQPGSARFPLSHRAVASLPRSSLGCSSRGRGQPSGDPVSKAGGGNREGRRRGRREVEQFQDGHAHAAAPREHAGGRHPFVAAGVVLLDGVEAGAAVVASHGVEPAVHGHQVVGAPGRGQRIQKDIEVSYWLSSQESIFCEKPNCSQCRWSLGKEKRTEKS